MQVIPRSCCRGAVKVGNTGGVAEGKPSYIVGDNEGKHPGPFAIKPVAVLK